MSGPRLDLALPDGALEWAWIRRTPGELAAELAAILSPAPQTPAP